MRYSIYLAALLLSGCMNPASMQRDADKEWHKTKWIQSCEIGGGNIVYISNNSGKPSHRKMSCLVNNKISQYEENGD